jgi:hypothetical protein
MVVEWTDNLGRHHFKVMSNFAAEKYLSMLEKQGFRVLCYAA